MGIGAKLVDSPRHLRDSEKKRERLGHQNIAIMRADDVKRFMLALLTKTAHETTRSQTGQKEASL